MASVLGPKGIGLVLLLVGVFTAGLLLFAAPAEAHGAHAMRLETAAVDAAPNHAAPHHAAPDHTEHGHLNHCHGGAFCPGAAIVALTPVLPAPMLRRSRCTRPGAATANAASTAFDPPPPRALI